MSEVIRSEWLTPGYGGQHKVYIANTLMPLPPSEITVTIDNKNEKMDLANGGTWKVLNDPGLTQYEFELILPGFEHAWVNAMWDAGFKEPYKYLALFERLKTDPDLKGRVFPFVIIRSGAYQGAELMQMCSLEDYTIHEKAEDTGDFRVAIKLEVFMNEGGAKFDLEAKPDGSYQVKPPNPLNKVKNTALLAAAAVPFIVNKDVRYNTLYKIAAHVLGDGEQYKRLAELNKIENPNLLKIGQVIKFW